MAIGVQATTNPQLGGDGHYRIGKFDQNINSEQVTLSATTVKLASGTVLGKLTSGGKFVPLAPGASDGSQTFAGILVGKRPISTGDQRAVVDVRGPGIVNVNLLVFVNAVDAGQKATVLAAMSAAGIQAR